MAQTTDSSERSDRGAQRAAFHSSETLYWDLPAPLDLELGGRLERVRVGYRTWGRLAPDGAALRRLVRSNWTRTAGWTARGILALEMIRRIVDEAKPRGLKLGIENREALEEIPFESDYDWFMNELRDPTVVYWHDTGHVQTCQNLGLADHVMWLFRFQKRLPGAHLHDVVFPHCDHQLPETGTVRFDQLKALRKPGVLKVFELISSVPADDIRAGWLEGKSAVGVTAGASAPEILVRRVVERLQELGATAPEEMAGRIETITFSMPRELRPLPESPGT